MNTEEDEQALRARLGEAEAHISVLQSEVSELRSGARSAAQHLVHVALRDSAVVRPVAAGACVQCTRPGAWFRVGRIPTPSTEVSVGPLCPQCAISEVGSIVPGPAPKGQHTVGPVMRPPYLSGDDEL